MEKRIYYHDTDCGGVVYYGRYLDYLEESRTEYLENCGLSVCALSEAGLFFAVRSCNIIYQSPARYGDILECSARLLRTSGVQLVFEQSVVQKVGQKSVLRADVAMVCLNRDFRPAPIPGHLRKGLK